MMNDTKPNINVTPLIDVLLVLLIIFMIVSPLKPSDFKAKIPREPKEKTGVPHPLSIVVALGFDSSIRLNDSKDNYGTSENTSPLTQKLHQIFGERERNMAFDETGKQIQKTVFIKAPRNLEYGKVVKIVDAVKLAGADPISLQIDDLE